MKKALKATIVVSQPASGEKLTIKNDYTHHGLFKSENYQSAKRNMNEIDELMDAIKPIKI